VCTEKEAVKEEERSRLDPSRSEGRKEGRKEEDNKSISIISIIILVTINNTRQDKTRQPP